MVVMVMMVVMAVRVTVIPVITAIMVMMVVVMMMVAGRPDFEIELRQLHRLFLAFLRRALVLSAEQIRRVGDGVEQFGVRARVL